MYGNQITTLNISDMTSTNQKIINKAIFQLENAYTGDFTGRVLSLNLNDFTFAAVRDKNTLEVHFENAEFKVEYTDTKTGEKDFDSTDTTHKNGYSCVFTIGFKTPKGYISSKKIPVDFDYIDTDLTEEQAIKLLEFETDAKKNTFDPFFAENEAKRKNASAWNYIAANYITDPYCTK